MKKRTVIFISVVISVIVATILFFCMTNREGQQSINHTNSHKPKITAETKLKQNKANTVQDEAVQNEYELYSSETDLPFTTLFDISKLSETEKEKADKILSGHDGLYVEQFNKDTKQFIIISQVQLSNKDVFDRHNLEVLEVTLHNGHKEVINTGYSGKDGETANSVEEAVSDNESWDFDKDTEVIRPLKHTVFNNEGDTEYEETWNYDENEPIKYEMKNGTGHTVSVFKETFNNATDYDKEHIFYDKEGQTELLVSIHYEGADITRITYYNAKDKENCFTIVSEYTDGIKTAEKIYNKDYALISDIKAEYKDGQISALEQNNNKEKEVIRKRI